MSCYMICPNCGKETICSRYRKYIGGKIHLQKYTCTVCGKVSYAKYEGVGKTISNKEAMKLLKELEGAEMDNKRISEIVEVSAHTDKLSVEKLQEQLNTAKKALAEIAEIIDDNIHECNYGCDNNCELNGSLDMYSVENVQSVIDSALAAIGGKELGVDLVKVVEG